MDTIIASPEGEARESPPVLISPTECAAASDAPALAALPRPLALVPPPVVTRSGRVVKPVKDAYIDKNRRSITRLVVHDAKQSMLDDLDAWKRQEPGGAAHTAAVHWPVVNVHDTYRTVLAEYTRVHLALFHTAPPDGDEGVPDGYDEDVSYVDGDSQAEGGPDSGAEEDGDAEEEEEDEEEDDEEEADDEEDDDKEDEDDEDGYRTPPRAGRTRPRSDTRVEGDEDDDVFAPPPAPKKRARGVEGGDEDV